MLINFKKKFVLKPTFFPTKQYLYRKIIKNNFSIITRNDCVVRYFNDNKLYHNTTSAKIE